MSLTEFAALYHPKLSAIHISMGPESVTNLYQSCTYWQLYERQLLGDFVPFKQIAPPEELDAACDDILLTYIEQMDKCLADFIERVGSTNSQATAVSRLHQAWKIRALEHSREVISELRNLTSTEISFMPGYASATKSSGLIDDIIMSCITERTEGLSLLPPPASSAVPPPLCQPYSYHHHHHQYPAFGGGGDPHEPIFGPV